MHVVVSSTTWNLKGNLPRWSSKLQATRFSKDLICDTFFRIKVSPLYFRETKRTEEFVILEVSLWDQFGFKNGSWTIIWHNDTTLRCNYAPCNRQVHLNLRADLHLLVCLFPQWGCRLSFCSCTLKDRIVVVWTNFYWGRSATCNLEIVYTQQPKFACSELRPSARSLATLVQGSTWLTALNFGNELVYLGVCRKASQYAENLMNVVFSVHCKLFIANTTSAIEIWCLTVWHAMWTTCKVHLSQ